MGASSHKLIGLSHLYNVSWERGGVRKPVAILSQQTFTFTIPETTMLIILQQNFCSPRNCAFVCHSYRNRNFHYIVIAVYGLSPRNCTAFLPVTCGRQPYGTRSRLCENTCSKIDVYLLWCFQTDPFPRLSYWKVNLLDQFSCPWTFG